MKTDPQFLLECINKLIDYNWEDEMKNFQETYETEIQSQDDLQPWIEWCEDNEATDHVFYTLMVLSQYYNPVHLQDASNESQLNALENESPEC